jgi:hypothetical protein
MTAESHRLSANDSRGTRRREQREPVALRIHRFGLPYFGRFGL